MIYTFYSYKGGVGRSMALANVAELFYRAGLKVLMVDWDLEAPGLEKFFPINHEEFHRQPGLMDMLRNYKQQMTQEIPISEDDDSLPFDKPDEFIINIYPNATENGKLWILSAGRRSKENFAEYANTVRAFDWRDFYQNWEGELYFEWLRRQFERIADVIFIDSRTGVTEIGGVCTYQLADVVVMFCSANQQCLEGTEQMVRELKRPQVQKVRGRNLEVLVVPARIDDSESNLFNNFSKEFIKSFSPYTPRAIGSDGSSLWQLAIPYITSYAYKERIAVREQNKPSAKKISAAFSQLTFAISLLAPDNSPIRSALPITNIQVGGNKFIGSFVGNKNVVFQSSKANINISIGDIGFPFHPVFFRVPPRPNYYVDRPEYSQDLKTRLLTESSDVQALVVTAIHGLGSVGKSTLAAALAHDKDVQDHFSDGILWATLGQQPNLGFLLSGWVEALGDYDFKATSVEATSNHLRKLLYDKAVLLVIDDVWNIQHAQAFNVGGARCQVLVTTREAAIADALGANTYSLHVMTSSQAMELLTKKLGYDITEVEEAGTLAKKLGYLPLALELAAAQVESGVSWAVLLQDVQGEIAQLKTFDRPGVRDISDEAILKRLSLTASLNLSIQRLPDETRENFIWLGILLEDVNITQKITAILWDMDDERDAVSELRYLHSKALLLSGAPLEDGTPTYRLHNLFHDLARNLLTASPKPKRKGNLPGLGITLPAAHATFLEKYRNLTDQNLWHTLPNDGYIHQHLVQHLEKAEKVEEIHKLLAEKSATGGNGWYEACETLGKTANFVTDVALAWQLAEDDKQVKANLPYVVGLQCRYALITASINSLAANLPVELLIALIEKDVWIPEQGLAYALQNPELYEKATSLRKLVNFLSPNLEQVALLKALAAARQIQDDKERAYALSNLADKLPELLPEALVAARRIQDDKERTYALSNLSDKLPELLPEALVAARRIRDDKERAYALNNLADKLPKLLPEALVAARRIQDDKERAHALNSLADKLPELLPEARAAAKQIQDDKERAHALSSLADKLPELLPEARAAARQIQNDKERAHALSSLAPILPELLPEALAAARQIQDDKERAYALSSLADKLPPELLPEALAAARQIQNDKERTYALSSLAPILPELLPEALAAARQIQDDKERAYALSSLADKLPPKLFPEALAAARQIKDDKERTNALSGLAPILPELLPEVLAAARQIRSREHRANALSSLAPILTPELLPEALAAARQIQNDKERANALSSLAPILTPELLPEALAAARQIQDDKERTNALSSLAPILPELLPEALAAARQIQDDKEHANALSSLADKLPPELLPEALAAASQIRSGKYRANALSSLADKLPPELLPEALAAARQIRSREHRAYALSSLAPILPPELFPEALAAAEEIRFWEYRAYALSSLAPILPPESLPKALVDASQIRSEKYRANALSSLAPILPPELLPEALAAARQIRSGKYRAYALSSLAPILPPELLPEALAAARQIRSGKYRAYALSSLAPILPELLPEALAAARQIQDDKERAYALSSLAPILPPELLPEALAATREIQSEYYRANALSSLAPILPPELLPEALAAAREIQSEYYRANALSSLADKLSQIQKTQLFSLWQDTLHFLSLRTRPNLLTDIKALTPVMFTLGGQQAVKDTATAIQDVSRWWH